MPGPPRASKRANPDFPQAALSRAPQGPGDPIAEGLEEGLRVRLSRAGVGLRPSISPPPASVPPTRPWASQVLPSGKCFASHGAGPLSGNWHRSRRRRRGRPLPSFLATGRLRPVPSGTVARPPGVGSRGASAGKGSPSVTGAVKRSRVQGSRSLPIPQWLRVEKKEGSRIS